VTDGPGSAHIALDTLADVEEGIAGTQVVVAVETHLQSCAECNERLTRLRTTRALLTTLPAEPMPPTVRERVDTALAQAGDERSRTVVPLAQRRLRWNSPAVAGTSAAAAVIILVGALVAGHVIHRNTARHDTSSAEGATRNTAPSLSPAGMKEWATGANYTPASIPSLIPTIVTGTPSSLVFGAQKSAPGAAAGGTAAAPEPTATGRSALTQEQLRESPQAVLQCATALADGVPTVPVAVDFAKYDGKPAVILALPTPAHPTLLDIWVVRTTCSSSNLDLYFQRVSRP
jgi:hypothetical protein